MIMPVKFLLKAFSYLPDSLFCGELRVLYESGRLPEFFIRRRVLSTNGSDISKMALTKLESKFVSWAIREYYQDVERTRLKEAMLKHAITGNSEAPPLEKFPTAYAPLGPYDGQMGLALQDAGRKKASPEVLCKPGKARTDKGYL